MQNQTEQQVAFTRQKNFKALAYTAGICSLLLLCFIFISWESKPPAPPVIEDVLEIELTDEIENLGNNSEGFGEVQPLVKGAPGQDVPSQNDNNTATANNSEDNNVIPDDNAEADAAPVPKPNIPTAKNTSKPLATVTKPSTPVSKPAPKPKYTLNANTKGSGNNADRDNGYTMQGNNKNGNGDKGTPTGNPDSYGNKPTGKVSPASVIKGNRKISSFPSFTSDLGRATIYAEIKVDASGNGSFIRTVRPSTSTNPEYASRIRSFLKSIKFNAAAGEDVVTVKFNFSEN